MGVFIKARSALGWTTLVLGVFLITSGIMTGFSLAGKAALDGGRADFRKVVASEKKLSGNSASNSFTKFQMDTVRTKLGDVPVTFSAQPQSPTVIAEAVKSSCAASVKGVDSYYAYFHNIDMVKGSFISSQDENKSSDVIVIEDTLAWDIFRTNTVIGKIVSISGRDFIIKGVFKKDGSVIGYLTDDGIPEIFMTINSLSAIDSGARVTGIEAGTPGGDRLDAYKEDVSAALQAAGKNPADYNLTDFNIKGAILEDKPYLAVLVLGLISIVLMLTAAKKEVLILVGILRQGVSTDYLQGVIRDKAGILIFRLAILVAAVVTSIIIWVLMSFRLYIPPSLIPDQLIDLAYYDRLLKASINHTMTSLGYVPSQTEVGFFTTDSLLMWILCITVPIGLLLFYTGQASLSASGKSEVKRASAGVAALFASIALQLPVCAGLGISPAIGLQQLMILGLFVYLNSVRNALK